MEDEETTEGKRHATVTMLLVVILVALTMIAIWLRVDIGRLRDQNEWMLRELLDQHRAMAADLRQLQGEE